MKLTAFRVFNYRSVNDSGWIEIDPLTVLVGKNQAGKTALLRALHKFNPYHNDPYSLDREWPRGRRKERHQEATVVSVRFVFTEDERKRLVEMISSPMPESVEISRLYNGHRTFTFPDTFKPDEKVAQDLRAHAERLAKHVHDGCSADFRAAAVGYIEELTVKLGIADFPTTRKLLQSGQKRLISAASGEEPHAVRDQAALEAIRAAAQQMLEICPSSSLGSLIEREVTKMLPVFVYMDDYRLYRGTTFLNQLKERKDSKQLTEEDETVLILMEMAGLSLDDQVAKVKQQDREQRALDLNDASITLTSEMADRWSQEQYIVQFHADQYHFMTFVRSPDQSAMISLEEESKGFQWFFSFDLHFAHETQGSLQGAVLLLDEPGLHLHPKAQDDLLRRLEAYCKGNQLIFATHLPFMIDLTKPERIRVVERNESGTIVTDDLFSADEDARFSLFAKMGMSASQSLLVSKYNLVVEGSDDFWHIVGMSEIAKRAGKLGLDDRLQVTAAGGASEAAYLATYMYGQDLNVVVLFDSDKAGETAEEALIKKWLAKYRSKQIHILKVGDFFAEPRSKATLEDMFTEEFYLPYVNNAYRKELGETKLSLQSRKQPQLVQRIEAALKGSGVKGFNKGRPAKLIRDDLRSKVASDLPSEASENFKRLFAKLADLVRSWDKV
ncbi:MAG: AAA family ATPase [Chloroflexi bacterium]|nr:AAA family ATPase [Chloroflexota bacterium]